MLIGEYKHTLDPKKRLSLPSKWRKELGKELVVTRGLDNCLFVYPLREWEKITEKIGQLPLGQADTRSFNRFFLSGAVEVEVDSVGRILVPDFLKDFATLNTNVVLAGIHNHYSKNKPIFSKGGVWSGFEKMGLFLEKTKILYSVFRYTKAKSKIPLQSSLREFYFWLFI